LIVFIHQLIEVSITFLSFENVIRIDIRNYYEHLTYPAITLGFPTHQDLNEGKYEKIFNKKCFDQFPKKKSYKVPNLTEIFIDCIYSNNNITRNLLLRYPTFDEISQYIKLNLNDNNNNLFNLTIDSRLVKGLDLRIPERKIGDEKGPKKFMTIILSEESNKSINSNKMKQNILTITFDTKVHRKMKNLKYNYHSICLIYIHSPQLPLLSNDYSNKRRDLYFDLNRENTSLIVRLTTFCLSQNRTKNL